MVAKSESIKELAAALSKAQAEIKGAAKDSDNPFFKSRYADLSAVWDACREPLTKNGLAVSQFPSADGPKVTVETILMHESGEWISRDLTITAKEDSPQAIGSAVTYARRYALAAVAGVAPEDDDGEAAEGRRVKQTLARGEALKKLHTEAYVPEVKEDGKVAVNRDAVLDQYPGPKKRYDELREYIASAKDGGELDAVAEQCVAALKDKKITKANMDLLAAEGKKKREQLAAVKENEDFFEASLSK